MGNCHSYSIVLQDRLFLSINLLSLLMNLLVNVVSTVSMFKNRLTLIDLAL